MADRPAAVPTAPPRSAHRWWVGPLASLLVSVAMLPAAEVAVRLVAPRPPSWLAVYRRHPVLPTFALQPGARAEVDTGESRWTVRTDGRGFRVPLADRPPDDRPVALWLGDSYTFGQGVEYEDSFVGRLEADPARAVAHVNSAVGGYGPVQYRQTLEYLLSTGVRPRVVLLGTFLGNDFHDCIWSKDEPVRAGVLGDDGGAKSFLKRSSHLYRLAAAALHRFSPRRADQAVVDRELSDPASWSDGALRDAARIYREELGRIAALCQDHGVELRVLVIPRSTAVAARAREAGPAGAGAGPALPVERALSILRDLGIRGLDLTPRLANRPVSDTYFHFDGHFTPLGHALAAEAMRAEWADLLLRP